MALSATIHKIDLSLADMDSHRYGDYPLTLAQHPSETAERVMVRVLAYAMLAQDGLGFGRGISTDEDPDLHVTDLTGAMQTAVLVGLPEEKLVRQFSGRATQVVILAFGGAKQAVWWQRTQSGLKKIGNLTVYSVAADQSAAMADLLARNVQLSVSIQDGELMLSTLNGAVSVTPSVLKAARGR